MANSRKPASVDPKYQVDFSADEVSVVVVFNPETNSEACEKFIGGIAGLIEELQKKDSQPQQQKRRRRKKTKMGFHVEMAQQKKKRG
ncbi:MAG: hypothetical protein ABH822_02555 [Patescibacteria group bacterium]